MNGRAFVAIGFAAGVLCLWAADAGAAAMERGTHELYLSGGGQPRGALTGAVRYGHFVARGLEVGAGVEGGLVRNSSWWSSGLFVEQSFYTGSCVAPFIGASLTYGTSLVEMRGRTDQEAPATVPFRRTSGMVAGASAGVNWFVAPNAAISAAVRADLPSDESLRFRADPDRVRVSLALATRFYF